MSHDPLAFRRTNTQFVIDCWRRPVSCSVVGVGSVGKSNFFQNLASPALEAHVSALVGHRLKPIAIDPNLLGILPPAGAAPMTGEAAARRYWVGCELLFSRLYEGFSPFELLGEDGARSIRELYAAFDDGRNPMFIYLGLRYLELALDLLMRQGVQIVFMFDEFEQMLTQLPIQFFLGLRGLRDSYKDQLSFVTFTRAPLPQTLTTLGIDALAIEPFVELFNDSVHYLGAYNEGDARTALATMLTRKGKQYDSMQQNYLLWASGGFAGLMRATAQVLDAFGTITVDHLSSDSGPMLKRLLARAVVRSECATLWNGLNAREQAMLKGIERGEQHFQLDNPAIKETFDHLLRKGLVRPNREGALSVEPPLFAAYVASDRTAVATPA